MTAARVKRKRMGGFLRQAGYTKGEVVLLARKRLTRMGGVQRQAGYTEGEVILTAARIR